MVALGQFEAIEDHMRALRQASDIVNDRSGKVGHEFVSDGSMWFGAERGSRQHRRDSQVPERGGADLALDGRQRLPRRDVRLHQAQHALHRPRARRRTGRLARGARQRRAPGHGPEKLDNTVYFIRGLYDLADMARSKHDGATYSWARNLASSLHRRFDPEWWMDDQSLHADSLGKNNEKIQQKHWITSTPMEAELTLKSQAAPGLATFDHGTRSLALHETDCFSGERPYNRGLFHTGCGGGPKVRASSRSSG
jgi:hypothetical protein